MGHGALAWGTAGSPRAQEGSAALSRTSSLPSFEELCHLASALRSPAWAVAASHAYLRFP